MVTRLTDLGTTDGLRLDETDAIALALAALFQRTHPLARARSGPLSASAASARRTSAPA
jgi:hypothetical protein